VAYCTALLVATLYIYIYIYIYRERERERERVELQNVTLKLFGRKPSWPNWSFLSHNLPTGIRKITKTSVSISSVPENS
jgi:hypothetical protein